jgi:hypothetical protein
MLQSTLASARYTCLGHVGTKLTLSLTLHPAPELADLHATSAGWALALQNLRHIDSCCLHWHRLTRRCIGIRRFPVVLAGTDTEMRTGEEADVEAEAPALLKFTIVSLG